MFKKLFDSIFTKSNQSKGKTAQELIKELKNNKNYQEKIKQRELLAEASASRYTRDIQPLVKELKKKGVNIKRLEQIRLKNINLQEEAKRELVDFLINTNNVKIQRDILFTLHEIKNLPSFEVLKKVFNESDDNHLRWDIADIISAVGDESLKAWVEDTVDVYNNEKFIEPLMLYVAKWFEFEKAINILLEYIKVSPPFVLDALGQIGKVRKRGQAWTLDKMKYLSV